MGFISTYTLDIQGKKLAYRVASRREEPAAGVNPALHQDPKNSREVRSVCGSVL
jgi:hypothetical protein